MGKYDVDFDDYEEKEGSGYDGEVPKKGTYTAELVSFAEHQSSEGNDGLEWIFEITEGDYKGWRGWVYSNMDSAKWKTQQIVKAINGGKEAKTSLKPAEAKKDGPDSKTVKTAKKVRIRLGRETYDDEPRAKIRVVMPLEAGEAKGGKKKKKKGDDPF
jgi:hypothetical protein